MSSMASKVQNENTALLKQKFKHNASEDHRSHDTDRWFSEVSY